jgi:hypothetical protein
MHLPPLDASWALDLSHSEQKETANSLIAALAHFVPNRDLLSFAGEIEIEMDAAAAAAEAESPEEPLPSSTHVKYQRHIISTEWKDLGKEKERCISSVYSDVEKRNRKAAAFSRAEMQMFLPPMSMQHSRAVVFHDRFIVSEEHKLIYELIEFLAKGGYGLVSIGNQRRVIKLMDCRCMDAASALIAIASENMALKFGLDGLGVLLQDAGLVGRHWWVREGLRTFMGHHNRCTA